MVGLCGNQAIDIVPVFGADQNLRCGNDLFRNAAHAIDPDEALIVDTGDDETDDVHMGEYHQGRRVGLGPVKACDDIADLVDYGPVCIGTQIVPQTVCHLTFIAGEAGDRHVLTQKFFAFRELQNNHSLSISAGETGRAVQRTFPSYEAGGRGKRNGLQRFFFILAPQSRKGKNCLRGGK